MIARRIVAHLFLVGLLAGCGGGSPATDAPEGALPGTTPGTSTTHVLVAPVEGEDVASIADDWGAEVLGPVDGTGYYLVSVPKGTRMPDFAGRMRHDRRVEHAEPDWGMSAPEGGGSTLPAGGLLVGSMIPLQPELLRIGAEAARARASGVGVRVAILDTGLLPHEVVDANVATGGWDFVDGDADPLDEPNGHDDDGDGLVDEGHGHGLFVASLVLAVAPDAGLVPLRVLDSDAIGRASVIAAAIHQAADLGVDVVNLSLGMEREVGVLAEAVSRARERGVFVVASAGNTGSADVFYPSAIPGAFAVTAVDEADARALFASYGPEVDLAAPGVDLLGAYPSPSGTATWSGTSFSAALVSGAYALLRQLDPAADPSVLSIRLSSMSASLDAANPTLADQLGAGRIDLDAATAP